MASLQSCEGYTIKVNRGGRRKGAGRKLDKSADRRVRMVHLLEAENEHESGRRRRKGAIAQVALAEAEADSMADFRNSIDFDRLTGQITSNVRVRDRKWRAPQVTQVIGTDLDGGAPREVSSTLSVDGIAVPVKTEVRAGFQGLTSGFAVPGWELPLPESPCACEADSAPHWHCQNCHAVLTFGLPQMGYLDERGELSEPVLACDTRCRDEFLTKRGAEPPL